MGGRSNPFIRWSIRAFSSTLLISAVVVPFAALYAHDLATAASVGQLASLPMTALGIAGTVATRSPSRKANDARQGVERGRTTPQYAPRHGSPDVYGAAGAPVRPARSSRVNRFVVAASAISCLVTVGSFAITHLSQSANAVDPSTGLAPSAATPATARTTSDGDNDPLLPAIPAAQPSQTGLSDKSGALLFDGEVTLPRHTAVDLDTGNPSTSEGEIGPTGSFDLYHDTDPDILRTHDGDIFEYPSSAPMSAAKSYGICADYTGPNPSSNAVVTRARLLTGYTFCFRTSNHHLAWVTVSGVQDSSYTTILRLRVWNETVGA